MKSRALPLLAGGGLLLVLMGRKRGGDVEDRGGPPVRPPASGGSGSGSGSSSSSPGTGGSSTPGWWSSSPALPGAGWGPTNVPDSVIVRMAQAVATHDPEHIRAVALQLNQEGYNQQAEDLLRAAELIEQAGMITDPMTGMPIPSNTVPPTAYPASGGSSPAPPVPGTPSMPDPYTLPSQPVLPKNPLLKRGMKDSPDVERWQRALRADGFGQPKTAAVSHSLPPGSDPEVIADGDFGAATETATKIFQTDYALDRDGQVGDKTWSSIGKQPVLGARLLKLGSRGPAVKVWQAQLVKDGAGHVPIDGIFGPVTETATKDWQKARGLSGDGDVGPKTIAAIGKGSGATPPVPMTAVVDPDTWRTMRRGTAGKDVAEWQLVLNRDGFGPLDADGKFGPATEEATKQWQHSRRLPTTGIVDKATREAIDDGADNSGDGPLATRVMGDLQPLRAPSTFRAVSPLPGLIPEAVPSEVVPADRSLAARFARHVFTVRPGDEDREFVREFQRQHALKPTGVYGPGTALALVPYGIVPPKPFYWPRKGLMRAKAQYRVTLLEQSKRDPQRQDEWAAAANV